MKKDQSNIVAFDGLANADERREALSELHRQALPVAMLGPETISEIFEFADMHKAIKDHKVPFPGPNQGKKGMQSVRVDNWLLQVQGDWQEKRGVMTFDMMKAIVEQTPVLNAVVMTRLRQLSRFCRVNDSGEGPGFTVRHIDKDHQITKAEQESISLLNRFFANCGWEFSPRKRKALGRDSFAQFIQKLARDSLVMDSAPIETQFRNQRSQGIDGLYAVDGATIRLCSEEGYRGDDEIFALQVIQGRIMTAYTHDDLIYEPRNPRSDVGVSGYGLSEVELMVRVVTGFLNAMTVNIRGFDSNSIPKGMLHLSGNYGPEDIEAFKRYWKAMVRGVDNAWAMPVMVSRDQESKASFERFGVEYNEMYFSKWMTFLTSIICAIYGISPAEINFDSFTGGNTSALSGSDTEEKLTASKDLGLRPLLAYFENTLTDFVVADFDEKYVFRWTGLDEEDKRVKDERAREILTVNEMRAQEGYEKLDNGLGDAPLNPSLISAWLQLQQGGGGEDGDSQEEDEEESGSDDKDSKDNETMDFGKSMVVCSFF